MTSFDEEYDPIFDDIAPDGGNAESDKKDYKVGYGKPPKEHQFKPGESGNKSGRKKGTRNFATDAKAALAEPVRISRGGKTKKVSSQYAALFKLREKALQGDARSMEKFIELARLFNVDDLTSAHSNLSADDEEILGNYQQSILATANPVVTSHQDNQPTNAKSAADSCNNLSDEREDDDDAWLK